MARQDPFTYLGRAIELAAARKYASARAAVDLALAEAPHNGTVRHVAGLILFVTRDYQRSLDELYTATELAPRRSTRTIELIVERAGRLGWEQDVRDAIDAGIASKPDHPRWYVAAAGTHARGRNWPAALRYTREALALVPENPRLRMEVANVLARIGKTDEARDAVFHALEVAPKELVYKLEAARIFSDSGAFAEAAIELHGAIRMDPTCADAYGSLAQLALWRDDRRHARQMADHALKADGVHSAAGTVLAAIDVMEGRYAEAAAALDAVLDRDDQCSEAFIWRAEARMHLGRFEEAHDDLTWGSMCSDGYLIAAWILRLLVNIAEGDPQTVIGPERPNEILDGLEEMCADARQRFASGDHEIIGALLQEGLERMRGCRSTTATWMDDAGVLHRLRTRTGARHASRHALELIRSGSAQDALARFEWVLERFGHDSLPLAHRGELYFWMGDFDRARADLERAIEINRHTRWAYIGLTGIDLLEGNPQKALETSAHGVATMDNTEGPAVFAYRGEALLRLGRIDEAIVDLERSLAGRPARLGSWIGLALAHHRGGKEGGADKVREIFARIASGAAGLISDAAAAVNEVVWGDGNVRLDTEVIARVLEQALLLMGGNRSSTCTTYFTATGQMRYATGFSGDQRGPHETDADDLRMAKRMVMRARPRRQHNKHLTDSQVEEFVERGYIALRGAFPRGTAQEWVADANRRVATAPQRWVKGYDPSDTEHSLTGYDPTRSETWTWERMDIEGDRQVRISELAPTAWDAICDLLGGEHRVETKTWTNYLIANLCVLTDSTDYAPGPDADSWHMDDPTTQVRLSGFDRGMIIVALFSDVKPTAGGTFLAPESVGHVSRLLADNPEGVDFRARTTAPQITQQCTEFVEVTGQTGDVFLLHPFMLHSSSLNPSGRIRWIANPMMYTHEPLDFDRADPRDYSPVERAVVRGLGR